MTDHRSCLSPFPVMEVPFSTVTCSIPATDGMKENSKREKKPPRLEINTCVWFHCCRIKTFPFFLSFFSPTKNASVKHCRQEALPYVLYPAAVEDRALDSLF